MRVLHVAQPVEHGVPRVAADLAIDQARRGWAVVAAGPAASDLHEWVAVAGVRFVRWDATREAGPSTLGEVRSLARIVADAGPNLVHLHSSKAGLVGRCLLRGTLPTVFQPHAWSFEAADGALAVAARAWERSAACWADSIVCVSADERRRGESAGICANYAVLPNGIDLGRLPPARDAEREAARGHLGIDKSVPLVVHVGRFCTQKGQDVLLDAWPAVVARVPRAQLALVGDGVTRLELEARSCRRVTFVGETKDRVREWLVAAEVVVVPSRWEAGLPLIAMEAMASSRSVVGTDVAGMRDGLASGAGAIVPVGDSARLADAITVRLLDPALACGEGEQARRRIERSYDLRRTTAAMAAHYKAVMQARAEARRGPGHLATLSRGAARYRPRHPRLRRSRART